MKHRVSDTPVPLHTLRLVFPPVVTLLILVLTEWIARGKPTCWHGGCCSSSG